MIDVLLMTTSRSAPATSSPWLNAPRTTTSKPKRNNATANEPIVSVVRSFLRNRLAMIRGTYFIGLLPRQCPPAERLYRDGGRDVLAVRPGDRASPSIPSSCVRSKAFRAGRELHRHSCD